MLFKNEIVFLANCLKTNGYAGLVFFKTSRNLLKMAIIDRLPTQAKEFIFIKRPYLGIFVSFNTRKQVNEALKHPFTQIKFNFVFANNHTGSTYLRKELTTLRK